MADQDHLAILLQGVQAWNTWRAKHVDVKPDLREADLREADLREAYLREADLERADLSGAHLYRCDLHGSHLYRANLRETDLREANLNRADLREADLRGANLQYALLVGANFERANLSNCAVYGASAWNVHLEDAIQTNLAINGPNDPIITVDDLEVAQFIYLLLDHQKLRNVITAVTLRGVLILGRFSDGGLQRLQALAAKLREMGYLPMMFDFDRPSDRNYTETVQTLAGLSRFVVADLSGPSVPQELQATVPHFKIPFVLIMGADGRPYALVKDIEEYPWVVRPPVFYADTVDLVNLTPSRIVAPAEDIYQKRQSERNDLFRRE